MNAIEKEFEPLENQLPKDYDKFERSAGRPAARFRPGGVAQRQRRRVRSYLRILPDEVRDAGRTGQRRVFHPASLVQTSSRHRTDHGIVFDPACGSGGMFVQSSHFIERQTGHQP